MCQSCEAVRINGVLCHELGCPDSWKDYRRECRWCGTGFYPTEPDQWFDEESCAEAYNG